MKKLLSLFLALSLLALCGCGGAAEPTEVPTTAPTTEATEAPTTEATTEATEASVPETTVPATEPVVYTNPLTGETLDAPLENRIFAVTINNIPAAMPHYGVSKADLYFEMFINDHATRGLALYADITEVESVGSVRSLRYNFTDICQSFEAIVVYAGGSDKVLNDLYSSGIPHIFAEGSPGDYYYRDYDRQSHGYSTEHCLFVKGPELLQYAKDKGLPVTERTKTSYGLSFTEDATPENGENASTITINMIHDGVTKTTIMNYDAATGLYAYNQYKNPVMDDVYNVQEAFKNVIVMFCQVTNSDVYHVANLEGSGEGYFACNGKIIPIQWSRTSSTDDFHFTLTDGTPLELGIGSSYIAIAPLASNVVYE